MQTSENVKEVVSSLFLLAGRSATNAARAFMANGTMTKEMTKEGNFIAFDNCRMFCIRGPAKKVNIAMPNNTCKTDLRKAFLSYTTSSFHTICKFKRVYRLAQIKW